MKQKEITEKIKRMFNGLEIFTCTMCGGFLSSNEYKQSEGVCRKHWDD